jgi:hypothetical protein
VTHRIVEGVRWSGHDPQRQPDAINADGNGAADALASKFGSLVRRRPSMARDDGFSAEPSADPAPLSAQEPGSPG